MSLRYACLSRVCLSAGITFGGYLSRFASSPGCSYMITAYIHKLHYIVQLLVWMSNRARDRREVWSNSARVHRDKSIVITASLPEVDNGYI